MMHAAMRSRLMTTRVASMWLLREPVGGSFRKSRAKHDWHFAGGEALHWTPHKRWKGCP